jgi:hypothetical protein
MQGQAVFIFTFFRHPYDQEAELNYFKNITQCKKASLIEGAQRPNIFEGCSIG